jgi:hypothetical protein
VAVIALLVVEVWVAEDPPIEPSPLPVGLTVARLPPPLLLPIAVGLQTMLTFPAKISLVALGLEVALELPTLAEPFALGFELEVASPPEVLPLVVDLLFALDPLSLLVELLELPDADALAELPLVVPLVVEEALDPELVTAPAAVTAASASAFEEPTIALPSSV